LGTLKDSVSNKKLKALEEEEIPSKRIKKR
jgi:hypothetical protein